MLRDVAEAQLAALEVGDLGRFLFLSGERSTFQKRVVQLALDRIPASSFPSSVADALHRIAHLDREMSAHLTRMLAETVDELRALRQGRAALDAYGRPGIPLIRPGGSLDQTW